MPVSESGPMRGHVLVVDDSRVARATVTARLVGVGLEVREAHGCSDAAHVDLELVGAALLDLELGDGTGVDVAHALRGARATLPIAFLTSAPTSPIAALARALGPVFEKASEVGDAVAWIAEHNLSRGPAPGAPDDGKGE